MKLRNTWQLTGAGAICLLLCQSAMADRAQQELQKQLNAQVMSQQANVADDATLSKSLDDATERGKPTKSKVKDSYYRYWYNGFYYPHPYSYYRHFGYWF